MKTTNNVHSAAFVTEKLEQAFLVLNERFFESLLSKVVITVSPKGRKNAYGWFSVHKVWNDNDNTGYHEINISAEYLDRDIIDVLGTLLHEMVHLYCADNNIQDCSRSGQYHNNQFKKAAEAHGLCVEKTPGRGYASTQPTPETRAFLLSLGLHDFAISRSDGKGNKKAERQSVRRYRCPKCAIKIRATKDVEVICAVCKVSFKLI